MRLPSEADVQATIIDTARLRGYRVCHFRPARTEQGWRTPIEGDRGFPDVVLARHGSVFAFEIKGPRGIVSPDQVEWIEALNGIDGPGSITAQVVRPDDLDAALRAIERGHWS